MNKLFFLFFLIGLSLSSQEMTSVKGVILNSKTSKPLENVNIVNLNKVIGTSTNTRGASDGADNGIEVDSN